jgi:hypothetical protein
MPLQKQFFCGLSVEKLDLLLFDVCAPRFKNQPVGRETVEGVD